ncbi:MAG TPA: BatD family protein [Candidatus Cloacimonadota bacterium]|nr:BatD family protein [Candidatus Cloacimonadota bacterium]HPS38516.1 BatD family protein [Candidatus Cloacimonadota bacterium]
MKRAYFLILLLLSYCVLNAEVRVLASVSKLRIALDEQLTYTIRIVGDDAFRMDDPEAPRITGMAFRNMLSSSSSSISFSGGKRSREVTKEYQYVFLPSKPGVFNIPVQSVKVDGRLYSTKAFKIEVVSAQGGRAAIPTPAVPNNPFDPFSWDDEAFGGMDNRALGDVALICIPGSRRVYKGEPVVISYYLYSTQAVGSFQLEAEDDFPGYGKSVYFQPNKLDYEKAQLKGKPYLRALIKQLVLLPNATGQIQVPQLSGSARVYDYGYQNRQLRSEPSFIQVLPLPAGKAPASFTGAIGNFNVTESLTPRIVKLGEAVTYRLTIEGRGNFNQFTAPELRKADGIQSSAPQITDNLNGGVDGKRTVFYTIIPEKEGNLVQPELEFSWFDSGSGTYKTFRSGKATITVKPGNVLSYFSDMLSGDDPRELRPLLPRQQYHNYTQYPATVWWWLIIILTLVAGGFSAFLAWESSLRTRDPQRYSLIMSQRILNRYFKEAQLASQSLSVDFYSLAEAGLMKFLAEKYKLSGRLSNPEKLEALANLSIPEEDIELLRSFIDKCQRARFMPGGMDASVLGEDLGMLQTIVRSFIRKNRGTGGNA